MHAERLQKYGSFEANDATMTNHCLIQHNEAVLIEVFLLQSILRCEQNVYLNTEPRLFCVTLENNLKPLGLSSNIYSLSKSHS